MDFNIVLMEERHLDGVSQLEKACFSRAWSRQALKDEIENPNAHFLVAERDGEVLGYVGCIFVLSEGSITNVAVSPLYRRQKIADSLIQRLINDAKDCGNDTLFLEVRCSNEPAISLYKKHGFSCCATRKNFYRDPTEDAYIMRLSLN